MPLISKHVYAASPYVGSLRHTRPLKTPPLHFTDGEAYPTATEVRPVLYNSFMMY